MGTAKQGNAMNTHDSDRGYDRLKADVAAMRINCVTKQDMAALEERLLAQIGRLGEKLEATNIGLAAVAAQLPHFATKADLHEFGSSIRAWMVTAMISMFLGFAGLGFIVVNALKPISGS